MAFSLLDIGRTADGMKMLDESLDEARSRGYSFIAHDLSYTTPGRAYTR